MSCPKCAVARVKECLPSSLPLVLGVTCHKKQISCARVAYFPFDFQWFSCECLPLLTLEFRQFWLRRVFMLSILTRATRGRVWHVCVRMWLCECVRVRVWHAAPSTAVSLAHTGPRGIFRYRMWLNACPQRNTIWRLPLSTLAPPPRLLASLMYELHVASRTCGSKRNFRVFHKNLQKYFSLNFGHKFPTGDWSAEFGCPLWQRLDKRFNYYQPDGGIEGRGGDLPGQEKGASAGDMATACGICKCLSNWKRSRMVMDDVVVELWPVETEEWERKGTVKLCVNSLGKLRKTTVRRIYIVYVSWAYWQQFHNYHKLTCCWPWESLQ